MTPIFTLLRKDLLNFFRNRAAIALTFAVPFAMIYLFGQIFGVNRKDSGPIGIPFAVVNASARPAAAKLVEALKGEKSFRVITETAASGQERRPLTEADLRPLMQAPDAAFRFALVIPADVIGDSAVGLRLKFFSNPRNEIETQTVNGLLQKTIFSHVPELLGESLQARAQNMVGDAGLAGFNRQLATAISGTFGGDPVEIEKQISTGDFGFSRLIATADENATGDLFSKFVSIDTEQVVGANVKSPAATALVGGWAIQFLLFALTASATAMFRERDAGIFQRLLSAPVTRTHILWSKFLYGVVLGLVQLVALFTASSSFYGIEIMPHFGRLAIVCIFAAGACTSFGMLIAAISPNAEAANGLATFCIMLMSCLGGAWFPITLMPLFIQQFSKLTLIYWAMEGFSAVLWAGQSLVQLLPTLGILAGITASVMAIAVWRFNRSRIFD